MRHIWRYYGNYIFFCAAFSLFEVMLRLSTSRQFDFLGFTFAVLFNCIIALVLCSAVNFLSGKVHVIVSNMILILIMLLYTSQIIYFQVFGTFYNTESMFNAGQITQFWVIILGAIWERLAFILICLSSIPVYNIFVRPTVFASANKSLKESKQEDEDKYTRFKPLAMGLSVTLFIVMFTAFVPLATNPFSPYSMFFGQHNYEDSIKRTGFLSTLQLDLLKVVVSENTSDALLVLDELRDSEQFDFIYVPQEPEPEVIVATPEPTVNEDDIDDYEIDEEPPPAAPVVYGFNTMDIDFVDLIDNARNNSIKNLHEYFAATPPTQKNEYTGMFEGYNLVMFVAEAFSPFAVREDLTPTLYKLVHEGFYFSDFYTPSWGVSTSDGEYVALTGLLPKSGVWSFSRSSNNYLPFVMGNQLKELGYTTVAYHNHTHTYYNRHRSHPNMGYDYKGVGNGLKLPKIVWPNSDFEMIQVTIDEYIDHQPFHAYYMTVSGHFEYSFDGNAMSRRHREAVEHLPYSERLRGYIACHIELDKALEYLLLRLNEAGIAENTVIVLSTDHYPYGLPGPDGIDGISEFLGHRVDRNFELYKNHLIIYAQGMEPVVIDKPSSSLDIIPTISNLMGLEYDSRLLMGRDILSNSDGLVIFRDRSFITSNGRRIRNNDFIPNPGVVVEETYTDYIRAVIDAKFSASTGILDLDYYNIVFGDR